MLDEVAQRAWSLVSPFLLLVVTTAASDNPHGGYSAHDINFGRLFKVATQTSKRLLKEVFVLMINRYQVSAVEKWPTTVAEFCSNTLCWSNKKFRDNFNAEERSLMEQPLVSADFDVSLITKMIHKLLPLMNLPESLSRAIRQLKNVRNRVCHEHQLLDDEQLRDNFDDLKKVFDDLFREVGEFFSINLEDRQEVFINEVDEILTSCVTEESSSYFEKMERFRADIVGKFIIEARRELMNQYSKLKTLNPFTWLSDDKFPELLVDKVFTPLHIYDRDRNIDIGSLLTTEYLSELKEEDSGILPSVLILSGIAGCGKTSLCRYILHDWTTGHGAISSLRSVDVVIHIEARNVTSSSLVSYLQKTLLKETCRSFEENAITDILQQLNVLYLVDGMDEATADGRKLVNELLSVLGNSRVIATTRPEFASNITQTADRYHLTYLKLRIYGFSDQGITDFTSKVFKTLVDDEDERHRQECEFLRLLKTSGRSLGDHLKLPLTVAMVICLWRDDQSRLSQVTSATSLYFEIMRMCTKKMISRLQATTSLHPLELETFTEEWLLALGKQASEMLEENEFIIDDSRRKVLMSMCSARQIDSIQVLSAFLVCEVNEHIKGTEYHFCFIHKSQMEYLAAKYLVHQFTSDGNTSGPKIAEVLQKMGAMQLGKKVNKVLGGRSDSKFSSMKANRWTNTLNFVVGHLCKCNASDFVIHEVVEILLQLYAKRFNAPALWQIVQESNSHPLVCKMVGGASDKNCSWHPEVSSLCNPKDPTIQLFQRTNLTLKNVVIKITGSCHQVRVLGEKGCVETRMYDNLLPLLSCFTQRPSMGVELKIYQQYYSWGSPETADNLLATLLPKGNLTAVMCHLGERGAAVLSSVKKIGEVCVRVSDPSVLSVLRNSLSAIKGKVDGVSLRLDLPWTVSPSSLPTFKQPLQLKIVLREVDDDHAVWAAEVIARLSRSYTEVDLVASSLTPSGGETFLKTLSERRVTISEKLTIRSAHRLEEDHYQQMSQMVQWSFVWWY